MQFIIGDIHGEITKLKFLIKNIMGIDKSPTLILIGDYLDKGENVYLTLKYLKELANEYSTIFLFGNHEYLWWNLNKTGKTDIKNYLLKYGAKMTMQSFKTDNIYRTKEKMFNEFSWLFQNLISHYIIDNYLIVHSGLRPVDFKTKIDEIKLENKLFNRYSFIKSEQKYQGKYKIIFGHTGFYSPYVDNTKIGVDTAACFLPEQPLTAFCIEEEFFINSKDERTYLRDISQNFVPNIPRNKPWRCYVNL